MHPDLLANQPTLSRALEQIVDSFEPEDLYFPEMEAVLEHLLAAQNKNEALLKVLYRLFADRHILFTAAEFAAIVRLIN